MIYKELHNSELGRVDVILALERFIGMPKVIGARDGICKQKNQKFSLECCLIPVVTFVSSLKLMHINDHKSV